MKKKNDKKIYQMLKTYYENPKLPTSLGGVDKLKAGFPKLSRKKVLDFLKSQPAYTIHKNTRKKYKTRKVIVTELNQIWGTDLMSMQSLSKYNEGYKYIIIFIDILSRFLYARPLKNKLSTSINNALLDIINKNGLSPGYIWSDRGSEYVNAHFNRLLTQLGIKLYHTKSQIKVSLAERIIRTIRNRMFRFFTVKKSYKWVDNLPNFVMGYNKSYHNSIKMRPADVTKNNVNVVLRNLYDKHEMPEKKSYAGLYKGSYVRIVGLKQQITKEAYESNSREIFKIYKIDQRQNPTTYSLQDLSNEEIQGQFYRQELVPVYFDPNGYHTIEKIIKTVGTGPSTKYLVRWEGFGKKFDSFVLKKNLVFS